MGFARIPAGCNCRKGFTVYAEVEAQWPLFVCYLLLFIVLHNYLVLVFDFDFLTTLFLPWKS
jgi:hypothetical protein